MKSVKNMFTLSAFLLSGNLAIAQCSTNSLDATKTLNYPCPDIGIALTGYASYAGITATGNAWGKFASSSNSQITKPVIFVEGLDLEVNVHDTHRHGSRGWPNFITGITDERYPAEIVFQKAPVLINELSARGYDVFYLDHENGATYMQANAMVLVDLILKINQIKVGNEPIVIIAASMGGQTAKYALSYMEANDMKHCTVNYISVDSPHQGANIPIGLQYAVDFFKELSPEIQKFRDALNFPASQQLLLTHIDQSSADSYRSTWLSDLNDLGNYPNRTRNSAITSGSVNGDKLFSEGTKLMTFHIPGPLCSGNNAIISDIWSVPGDNYHTTFEGKRPKGVTISDMVLNNAGCEINCIPCNIDQSLFYKLNSHAANSSAIQYDNCAGGKRNTVDFIGKLIKDKANGVITDNNPNFQIYQEFHGFIPTISGLDVYTSNIHENVEAFIGNKLEPVPSKYPFEAYYGPTSNDYHVEITGDLVSGNINWILNELLKSRVPITSPLTVSSFNNGVYNYARIANRMLTNLVVSNGGKLLVNANLRSEYGQNTPSPYLEFVPINPPSPGSTYTLETCYCENVVVTIDNNGQFILGDNNGVNNNKALVLFHDGSQLLVKNGGKLTIRKGSKLIMEKNTILTLEQGGQIIIEQDAELIIQGTSQFKSSGVITINSGKLTQEPLSTLELMGGSKLIVNDNSQVIIKSALSYPDASENAVLTFNAGAAIQLKGDNAVLELNGRLHIGDNAIFTFTYPGSNSGYIKFNRGNAWWDNWAPNNAHITCGTNAKIQLSGQSKTDKIIDIHQTNVAIPKNLALFNFSKGLVEFSIAEARLETDRPTFINNSTFKGTAFGNGPTTRGLLMFGQKLFYVTNSDFDALGYGIYGALFYMGNKFSNVRNCNFTNCAHAIEIVGTGYNILNNTFFNNSEAMITWDNTYNSLIKNNTISTNLSLNPIVDPERAAGGAATSGINIFGGTNAVTELTKNRINNIDMAICLGNTEATLKCNDLQNNALVLSANENSKIIMSDILGSGFNNASNSFQFACFYESNLFEANNGFNAFDISDQNSCTTFFTNPGHIAHTTCPIISSGSLVNFTTYNTTAGDPYYHYYETVAENNFWRPITGPQNAIIEKEYNTIHKNHINGNPLNARIVTGNALWDKTLVDCPYPREGGGGMLSQPSQRVHPLDNNSNSSSITTASFYNKKLQTALKFSISKMDKLEEYDKVNEAAGLLTEILKANYVIPVKNPVDKYLLELAYQKLFACVAQLTEWERDSTGIRTTLSGPLQNRFKDLRTIANLRITRKDLLEPDAKEVSDFIRLDKAMVYRLEEDRMHAMEEVKAILESQPKNLHRAMYEQLLCLWSAEDDALNNVISADEALSRITACNEAFRPSLNHAGTSSQRMAGPLPESNITYAKEYAIAVYPNPTSGNLVIAYSLQEFSAVSFELFDIQGKKITSASLSSQERQFNIDNLNLENGVYFYSITGDNKNLMTKKLVVVK